MTDQQEVINALRNAAQVARFVEDAGVETCSNAVLIRALNLCTIGPTLELALAHAWDTGLPIDTPASTVIETAWIRLVCQGIEANF